MATSKNSPAIPSAGRRARVSQSDVPRHDLAEALRVARAIEDHYAGSAVTPLDVATSLDSTPTSSWFRTVTGAAVAYGLTNGAVNSPQISLAPIGKRVVAPTDEGEADAALVEALQQPRVVRDFLRKYDQKKLPPQAIAVNVIAGMEVDKSAAERTLKIIVDSARFAGVLRSVKGQDYVDLRGGASTATDPAAGGRTELDDLDLDDGVGEEAAPADELPPPPPSVPAGPKAIFVGHGKNLAPLKKLEKILSSFKIPYKVVVDEPNLGRPIPTKVKTVMKECGSAILIFTKDEQFFDKQSNEVWRPSQNVVFELGAASYEYDDRVVILKEKGIEFPTNFESIGWIEFEQDSLESKGIEIIQELIGLGLVTLTPAG